MVGPTPTITTNLSPKGISHMSLHSIIHICSNKDWTGWWGLPTQKFYQDDSPRNNSMFLMCAISTSSIVLKYGLKKRVGNF